MDKSGPESNDYENNLERILEEPLTDAFTRLTSEYPIIKLGQRKFEPMQLPQVRSLQLCV